MISISRDLRRVHFEVRRQRRRRRRTGCHRAFGRGRSMGPRVDGTEKVAVGRLVSKCMRSKKHAPLFYPISASVGALEGANSVSVGFPVVIRSRIPSL